MAAVDPGKWKQISKARGEGSPLLEEVAGSQEQWLQMRL